MSNVWDWYSSINLTKNNLLDKENIKEYVPYVINKSLSYHNDSILLCNEMNRLNHIPSASQYQFYLNCLSKRNRFAKWDKVEKMEDIDVIKTYYDVSDSKAYEIQEILSKSQIEYIKNKLETCGLKK